VALAILSLAPLVVRLGRRCLSESILEEGFVPENDPFEDDEIPVEPAREWSWAEFGSILVNAFSAWFTLIGAVVSEVGDAVASHSEWQRGRKSMAEQGAREMEALIAAVEKMPAEKGVAV
jgi:hypothetical protein